jgi:putative membrane protein
MRHALRETLLAIAGVLAALSTQAIAQNGSSDMRFAREAAIGGITEVELGKIAVEKGSSERVKRFGQRMVDDHSKAGDDLKGIAAKDNFSLPFDLDASHKAIVDRFSKMSGTEFDQAYINDMVKDHETDLADFEKEATSGTNPDIKNWASNNLPTLRDHLRRAKDDQSAMALTSSK